MMLIMFESGYETTKDRMAEGQPQVVFYDLSQQQIECCIRGKYRIHQSNMKQKTGMMLQLPLLMPQK